MSPLYQGIPQQHVEAIHEVLNSQGRHYPMSVSTAEARGEARIHARHLVETFPHLKTLVDVGCAGGHFVLAWLELGRFAIGMDAHPDAPPCLGAPIFLRDATLPLDAVIHADAVTCWDMPEHVPEAAADGLVKNLTLMAPLIFFSAAPPLYAGAHGHINCQEPPWWEEKFARLGYHPWPGQDEWKARLKSKIETAQGTSFIWWVWSSHARIFMNHEAKYLQAMCQPPKAP